MTLKAVSRGTTTTWQVRPKDQDGEAMPALTVSKLYIRQGQTTQEFDLDAVGGGLWTYPVDTGNLRVGIANWAVYCRQGASDDADRIEITDTGVLTIQAASPAL